MMHSKGRTWIVLMCMIVCHQRTFEVRLYWDQWSLRNEMMEGQGAGQCWRVTDNGDAFEWVYIMTLCYE